MAEAADLVEDCLYLFQIILDRANYAVGIVESADVGNFWGIEVVHAGAGRSVYKVVSRVLVRPCGVAASGFYDFKNCIRAKGAMRIQRHTVAESVADARQLGWVDDVERDILLVVQIDALVKNHEVAGWSGTRDVGGIEDGAIIADVVKEASRDGRAASHQSEESWEGIRVGGSPRITVRDPVAGEFSQSRLGILADVVGYIESMQAIDTDEQYTLNVGFRGRLCDPSRGQQAHERRQQTGERTTDYHGKASWEHARGKLMKRPFQEDQWLMNGL